MTYRSPETGRELAADSPHSLAGQDERWPVVCGIPYLRAGSEALARTVLRCLDEGRRGEALAHILAENDPWWDEPPPPFEALLELVRTASEMTLREVMAALGWGRVGTYFAHRWADPTFAAGLELLGRHWAEPQSAFELACGVGHYLRALGGAGVAHLTGADIVFAKLWVAKLFVCPEANYICFDADAPWPIQPSADLTLCTDAFYFLREKEAVARRLRGGAKRLYAAAHIHNVEASNHSAGAAARPRELEDLFPGALIYDDAALTKSAAGSDAPRSDKARQPDAFSLVGGPGLADADDRRDVFLPKAGERLVRNPLIGPDGRVSWPSERYRDEYAPHATFGAAGPLPDVSVMSASTEPLVRSRDLLSLPSRW